MGNVNSNNNLGNVKQTMSATEKSQINFMIPTHYIVMQIVMLTNVIKPINVNTYSKQIVGVMELNG